MSNSTLEDIKAGDWVALEGKVKVRVDRVTKTLIIIGNSRFNKKTGYKIGKYDKWNGPSLIYRLTPEIEQEIAAYALEKEKNKLVNKIKSVDFTKTSLENLKKIIELIE